MKPLNSVLTSTPPSGIRRYFDVAAKCSDVVSLGVGEPDFITPERIRKAGAAAAERGKTGYTANAGLMELRDAVSESVAVRHGLRYDPVGEVLVTVGVSQGLDLALRSIVNTGDEVVFTEPSYVSYLPGIRFAGGIPVPVPSVAHEGFSVEPGAVEAAVTPRTKAILLCYPSNPTGTALSRTTLQAIVDIAVRNDLYVISDEIYERLLYVGDHVCVASLRGARERTVLLNGFSKAYAMTGWRVGYACAPAAIMESMRKLHQYTMLCAPHAAQWAALEALTTCEPDVLAMVAEYDDRRKFFVAGLNRLGLTCHEPAGAFYAFPCVRSCGLSSEEFADRLLDEGRVALVPGGAFGASGEGYVRCSYATSMAKLQEALVRLERFVERVRKRAPQVAATGSGRSS